MLTTKTRAAAWCAFLLSGLLAGFGCGTPPAQENVPQDSVLLQQGQDFLQGAQKSAGLDAAHGFAARTALQDDLQLNVRYDHLYRGVKIWGGDVIVHSAARGSFITGNIGGPIDLDVTPSLTARDIRSLIDSDLQPKGPYAQTPDVELVIYPREMKQVRATPMRGLGGELNAEDIGLVVVGHVLAYHAHAALENGTGETSHTDYLFDAHSGAILKKWDSLQTVAATGTGNSEYSGSVSIGTNTVTSGCELRDVARAMNSATYTLNHGTSGTGSIFTDADNTWGDGANYTSGGSTTSANGQTAGVDAHFGIAKTYDYYKNVHGRNGIDNANTATYNRVHYSSSYDNAFWDDTCFCMTYGDGSAFKVLTAIDVAGHEMTHGVTSRTAGLVYSGESGGLNESTSDIHGTMVEFYSRGGSGSTIGNTGGTWTIGEQLSSTPLRYMYKPSKDGSSPDAWSSSIGNLDVHYSSGPMNRAFYFLSQGSSSTAGSDFYSTYLPGGMTGVGNDHAARIGYRALTVYMTSSTNYAAARTAFLNAASDLYGGTTSADYAAVQNAFAAINVGSPAGGGGNNFSISASPSSVSVAQGGSATSNISTAVTSGSAESITLSASGVPSGASASFSTNPITAGGSSTLTLSSGTAAGGTYTVTITGTAASATHTTTVSWTINAAGGTGITNGTFETGSLSPWTSAGTASIVGSGAHGGTYAAQVGSTVPTNGDSSISQTFTAPSGGGSLSGYYKVVCPDSLTYDWATATLTDNTTATTTTVVAKVCSNTGAWVNFTAAVTGGHSYTLTLVSHDDNYAGDPTYTLYDDITIVAGPPPSSIANGTFETGSLSPWTSAGTTSIVSTGAHGGTYAARLGSTVPTNGDSSISQTFTTPSTASSLSFWYKMTCPDTVTYDWATATLKNNATGATTTVLAQVCTTNAWTQVTASVSANTSYTLTLVSHDDNYSADPSYTLYDDVTVQ